jgi:hypothetical protein
LNAPLGEIIRGLKDVPIGNLGHLQAAALEKPEQQKIRITGGGGRIELSRLGADESHEVPERAEPKRHRCREGEHDGGNARNRKQIKLRAVGKLVVLVRVDGKGSHRPEQQRVVVVGAGECANGDETVAARTVFDHHRLAPARAQPIGEQPRRDIRCARWSERDDEPHRARRIGLRRRSCGTSRISKQRKKKKRKQTKHCGIPAGKLSHKSIIIAGEECEQRRRETKAR